ncbi:MAG: DUF1295 domain-containing protein [Candidatus Latescibacteria bacterium]|nr:DUF1295 domain-containing protein [Candidatus Latescibacterota bacterium]
MPASLAWEGWLAAAGALSLLMFGLWLVQLRTGDAAIADVGWALGVGVLALVHALEGSGHADRRFLVGAMGMGWSLRLALHLVRDRVLPPGEDGRYRMLRQRWGKRAPWYFLVFFQVQALLALFFSLPFLVIARNVQSGLGLWDLAGAALWLVALGGESLADSQLARFRRDPANQGQVCRAGLWRYSRHPNYFCEWLHWCAYGLMAVAAPQAWVALGAPLLMLYLLFRATGIPHAEAQALRHRGELYAQYQRQTSAFFPWFPRKD